MEEAEIIREKGTNRSKFFRGQIDKYTWVNYGSSYLPSDMNAAYLYAQLEIADEINEARLACWNRYYEQLKPLKDAGKIDLPTVPEGCVHNAHMFYIKARDLEQRTRFISYMKENGVLVVFHYIPLHTAPAGQKFGRFHGEDRYTTRESERSGQTSHVLRTDAGSGRLHLWSDKRFLCVRGAVECRKHAGACADRRQISVHRDFGTDRIGDLLDDQSFWHFPWSSGTVICG